MGKNTNRLKKSAPTLHKCLMCPKAFKQQAHLNSHLNSHTKEKPYKCQTCDFACASKGNLERHVQGVHGIAITSAETKTTVKCQVCDYECGIPSMMVVHSRKHSAVFPYSCSSPGCGFKTNYLANIARHTARLHNHERPFKCKFKGCNHQAKDSGHLRQHFQVHSNARPFICTFSGCHFAFKTKGNLKTHTNKSHCASVLNSGIQAGQAVEPNPLVCTFANCDYQTEYPRRYEHHIKTHDEESRKHTCKFCSLRFRSSARLQQHMPTHTGEKPYSCSHCDFTTAYLLKLRDHGEKIHSIYLSINPQDTSELKSCSVCKTICMSRSAFVLHSLKHLQPVVVLERLRINVA